MKDVKNIPSGHFTGGSLVLETYFNSFLAGDDFCRLLITFASCLDQDQDPQNVSSEQFLT